MIGGWTEPTRSRVGFGALLVGYYDDRRQLRYAGKVGTGFTNQLLVQLHQELLAREVDDSPFDDPVPRKGSPLGPARLGRGRGFYRMDQRWAAAPPQSSRASARTRPPVRCAARVRGHEAIQTTGRGGWFRLILSQSCCRHRQHAGPRAGYSAKTTPSCRAGPVWERTPHSSEKICTMRSPRPVGSVTAGDRTAGWPRPVSLTSTWTRCGVCSMVRVKPVRAWRDGVGGQLGNHQLGGVDQLPGAPGQRLAHVVPGGRHGLGFGWELERGDHGSSWMRPDSPVDWTIWRMTSEGCDRVTVAPGHGPDEKCDPGAVHEGQRGNIKGETVGRALEQRVDDFLYRVDVGEVEFATNAHQRMVVAIDDLDGERRFTF